MAPAGESTLRRITITPCAPGKPECMRIDPPHLSPPYFVVMA